MIRPSSHPVLLIISKIIITSVWLKKHLKEKFHVMHETSLKDSLNRLKTSTVDFIIIDEKIKDEKPLNACRQLRNAISPQWIPILLITSILKKTYRNQALKAGATDFLHDPLDEQELETRVIISLKISDMYEKISEVSSSLKEKTSHLSQNLLSNKFLLSDRAIKELVKAKKEKRPLTIALIAMDSFKEIEKDCGILDLDKLLLHFSGALVKDLRKKDILIPTKGGKFILILPNTDVKIAESIAKKLRSKIRQENFETKKGPISLTISTVLTTQDQKSNKPSDEYFDKTVEKATAVLKNMERQKNKITHIRSK